MRRIAAALLVVLVVAPGARAQEVDPPAPPPEEPALAPAQRRALGVERARRAQAAWKGDAARAAELFAEAADLLQDEPALRYNAGVAFERAGDRKAASEAYEAALTGADTDVEDRSLFNVSALALDEAWQDLQVAKADPAQLAALLANAQGPDGKPLPEEQVAEAAKSLRMKAAGDGLQAVGRALPHLRDLVRRRTADRDALHNLELAQRVRRELEQIRQQEQSNAAQDPKDSEEDQQEKGDDQQDNPEQDRAEGQDGDQPHDDPQQQGESGDGDDQEREADQQEQQPGQSQDLSKQQAEQMLEQMLERAARRAREVREARERAVRRAPVEKDW